MHSLTLKMGTTGVFYQHPYTLGEMKIVGRGCGMRPEGPKIKAEGREHVGVLEERQQAPPAIGSVGDRELYHTVSS